MKSKIRIAWYALMVLAVVIGLYYFSVVLGWAIKPAEIYDADNVQKTYTAYIEQYNQLLSLKAQIQALDRRIQSIEVVERLSFQDKADLNNLSESRLSLAMSYNRQCASYNADWQNWYKAAAAKLLKLQYELPTECSLID